MHIRLWVFPLLMAHAAWAQDERPLSQVEQWYRAGQFQQAAEQGLEDLLQQPWNHELRFIVADSLQRSGKTDEAMAQFAALDGTPLAASAALRLNALRGPGSAGVNPVVPRPPVTLPARQLAQASAQSSTTVPGVEEPAVKTKPVSTLKARVLLPRKSDALQKIDELAAKGDYEAVARQGQILLAQDPNNANLRLLVANSLAWTGFLDQAAKQYPLLFNSPVAEEARIGLANVYRWRGQDEDALPLYQTVLARSPGNQAAKEGLQLARRELRPRTTVTLGEDRDSSDSHRRLVVVDHAWRDQSGKHVFEVETAGVNDKILGQGENERDLVLRYQALGLPFQPKVELGIEGRPTQEVFGNLRLHFGNQQTYAEFGRINWGKLADNAKALKAGLTADHVGLAFSQHGRLGDASGRLDYFSISDSNEIIASGLRFVPAWRPLGNHVKFFIGLDTRDARRAALNSSYWAPVDGFGTGFVGVQADFGGNDWSLYGSGQVGGRLYGEAANNWSVAAGGKRWLGQDWAIGLNFFKLSSTRDNASYRAKSVNLNLEKLWN